MTGLLGLALRQSKRTRQATSFHGLLQRTKAVGFQARRLLGRHALVGELPNGAFGFIELQSHPAQHVRRFAELDVVVADDLDAVAPRVLEVEKSAGKNLDTHFRK